MFKEWGEYFFMLGSSAASLIGLMFVVVTLTPGRNREQTEHGKHLYTSPIVWHLAIVVMLSGGAMAPTISARFYGAVSGALALWGIMLGVRNAIGIVRTRISGNDNVLFDFCWYGLVPAIIYVGLGVAATGLFLERPWGASGIAASLMALLLMSVHAEWDLVTFLAPLASPPADEAKSKKPG